MAAGSVIEEAAAGPLTAGLAEDCRADDNAGPVRAGSPVVRLATVMGDDNTTEFGADEQVEAAAGPLTAGLTEDCRADDNAGPVRAGSPVVVRLATVMGDDNTTESGADERVETAGGFATVVAGGTTVSEAELTVAAGSPTRFSES